MRDRGVKGVRDRLPGARPPARHGDRPAAERAAHPRLLEEYKEHTGRDARTTSRYWEPCHRALLGNGIVGFENVGGQIDEVTGKRVTFAAFPWRWEKGDGCIVRLVAIVDPTGEYRIETGDGRLMQVTRLAEAKPYEAPKHFDCTALRLQGFDASRCRELQVGLSHFLPGGGAELDATPLEKVYVVTEGEVTIVTDEGEATLGPLDSCYLAPNEARSIENRTNRPASMIVVMPYPPGARPRDDGLPSLFDVAGRSALITGATRRVRA